MKLKPYINHYRPMIKTQLKNFLLLFALIGFFSIVINLVAAKSAFATELSNNEKKSIHFATEATYPPFVTMSVYGTIGGFETELVKKLCNEANLTCEFHHFPFDSLFPNLTLKKIDAVYGGVGISEERKSVVLFSKPLYHSTTGFIHASDLNVSLDKDSFNNKIIAVQQGTIGFEKYLKIQFPNAKLKAYASIQDALRDLHSKRVSAVFGDIPVFKHWMKSNNQSNNKEGYSLLLLPKEEILKFSQGTAIAVRKEDKELIDKLNAAYDKLVQTNQLKDILQEHLN